MNYLKRSRMFSFLVIAILLLVFLYLLSRVNSVSSLFTVTISTLLIPTVVSLFLYYSMKPLFLFLNKHIKRKGVCTLIILVFLAALIGFLIKEFIPLLISQIDTLARQVPRLIDELDQIIVNSSLLGNTKNIDHYLSLVNSSFEDFIQVIFIGLQGGATAVLNFISSSFMIFSLSPIILVYLFLNTGKSVSSPKIIPEPYKETTTEMMCNVEKALGDYIGGKVIVCLYVFVSSLIVFKIAGIEGALIFAVIAGIMDIVPYFGPWIGAAPAFLVSLSMGGPAPWIILIGILIVQVGESNVVSPLIMSKELKIHPLLIIIVMLITGQLYGLVGMIIILPVLAVLQVLVIYFIKLYSIYKTSNNNNEKLNP